MNVVELETTNSLCETQSERIRKRIDRCLDERKHNFALIEQWQNYLKRERAVFDKKMRMQWNQLQSI